MSPGGWWSRSGSGKGWRARPLRRKKPGGEGRAGKHQGRAKEQVTTKVEKTEQEITKIELKTTVESAELKTMV